ncbi:MAG: integrase [Anaerolineales bacterium]
MSETDPMDVNERRKYLHKMWGRYREASKTEKGKLLDEMEAVTGLHRKTLIRTLNGRLSRKKRSRERGKVYGVEVDDAVRVIARSLDYPCAERLQPNLVWMAEQLNRHGELRASRETLKKLDRISVSTLKRILKRVGRSEPKLAARKPKRPQTNSLRKRYPMSRIAWNIAEAGHFEVDLVHHGGENTQGEYIHTLQMVDVATGWSEIAAIFGRSYRVMTNGFEYLLARLPFPILELHPDNGAEFFNQFLLRFWEKKQPELLLSRSRPYQKNDNRFVEENNQSLVRAYIGHGRLDTQAQLKVLRQLYEKLWLFHNFFQPVMRLQEKQYLTPLQYRRKYDQAKSPLQRLLEMDCLEKQVVQQLVTLRDQTNPLVLRSQIDALIAQLLSLPVLDQSETVNIFHTLIKEADFSVTLSIEPTLPFR